MEEGRIRIFVCCALALLLIVIGGVGYGVAQIAPPPDDSECIDSWDELLEEYLEFRESSYLLVAPTYDLTPTDIGSWLAGEEDPQLDPYWFWHFEGGVHYFNRDSKLGIKDGTRIILYEDIIKGEIVALTCVQDEDGYEEEVVYTAPLPQNKSDDITWGQYLYEEYARRRVVLSLTMRDLRRAKREYLSSQLETDTELVSRAMATRSSGSYTGVWISVEGPGQGAVGMEITVHVPEDYTNAVEIYTFEAQPTNQFRGLSNIWTLAATNLVPETNHTVTWQISDLSGLSNTYLSAGLTGIDADEDAIPDSREYFVYHSDPALGDTDGDYSPDGYEITHNTDPLSATSFPTVSVSGHAYLPGFGPRTVRVLATASSNEWESAFDTNILLQFVMAGFTITNIPGGGKYWLRAYYDADSSGSADFCDPHGEYTNVWICITNDLSGIDIHLGTDQTAPILQMPSNTTIACGESLEPSNTGEAVATDDWSGILLLTYTDTVTVVYSNFNRIIKREWTAEDCCTNSVTQTQTIYQVLCDLDMDSLPDEWEQLIVDFDSEDAITNVEDVVSGDDFDGDGLTNGEEFELGSDPTALDSDLDWAGDAYEVEAGTDPVDALDVPALRMVINDNDLYTHSSWLSLSFPGLVADSMDISESPYMSNSTTAAMSEPTTYILAHETNGLRTIYAELIRTSDGQNSPLLIGSIRLDTEPPTLQITSPTNNWTTSRRWISLEGVATDTVSEVQVLVDGEIADGVLDCEFHHNRHYLEEGPNLITVLGTDAAGNSVTQRVSVIQDLSNDTNAPVFTMNLPLDYEVSGGVTNWLNTTTYGSNEVLFLNGGIDDETAEIQFLVIANESTNGPFAGRAAETQLWGRVELFPGTNTLVVLADDAAGNVATGMYTIVRNTGMVFEITYPTAYETINAPSVIVYGEASPFFSNAVITVNGIACSVVDNGSNVTFSTVDPVPLNEGRNSIVGVAEVNDRVYYTDPEFAKYEIVDYSMRYNFFCDDSWDDEPPKTLDYLYAWDSETLIYTNLAYENGVLYYDGTEYKPTLDYEAGDIRCDFGKGTWDAFTLSYGGLRHMDYEYSASLSFIQHWPTEEVQTVVFQFVDMSYARPPDEEIDPSLITYREQTGFWYNGNVSFVVPIKTDTKYTITSRDFSWPEHDYKVITNSGSSLVLDHYFGTDMSFMYCTNEVLNVQMIPDYDHDGDIDDADHAILDSGQPFYFWKNDDDDQTSDAKTGGDSDVPGESSPDSGNSYVDGTRDLIDFFPVFLDLKTVLDLFGATEFKYTLQYEPGDMNFLYTDLTPTNAGNYLTDQTTAEDLADDTVNRIIGLGNGFELSESFLLDIQNNEKGIILVEASYATTYPLVLNILDSNNIVIFTNELDLSISGVEDMYRWVNLRGELGETENEPSDTGIPPNYPDSICNGKHVVFIHGFNVPEDAARGSAAEVFKRLYWSGSKAMYTAVTWYGNETPGILPAGAYYHADVINAFQTAPYLVSSVAALPGLKYMAGHSLGNMVVSSAIIDHGLSSAQYYMIDAAVAMQAYKATEKQEEEIAQPTSWLSYTNRVWASEWFRLFDSSDGRYDLRWYGRFGDIPQAINYYSSGEDVLDNNDPPENMYVPGTHKAWIFQEKVKGGIIPAILVGVDSHGGWGFNDAYSTGVYDQSNDVYVIATTPAEAALLEPYILREHSFFKPFYDSDLYGTNGTSLATNADVRAKVLAEAVPATSRAAGRNEIDDYFAANTDLMSMKTGWPASRLAEDSSGPWFHSDFKNIAYPYVHLFFDDMVSKGGLQ